jgi:hypothetical protein
MYHYSLALISLPVDITHAAAALASPAALAEGVTTTTLVVGCAAEAWPAVEEGKMVVVVVVGCAAEL